jgi:hypothetical protein
MHVLKFLLTAKNPFLHSHGHRSIVICYMHGSTFVVQHHIKVLNAILY